MGYCALATILKKSSEEITIQYFTYFQWEGNWVVEDYELKCAQKRQNQF
jgi:hypothetical protein